MPGIEKSGIEKPGVESLELKSLELNSLELKNMDQWITHTQRYRRLIMLASIRI